MLSPFFYNLTPDEKMIAIEAVEKHRKLQRDVAAHTDALGVEIDGVRFDSVSREPDAGISQAEMVKRMVNLWREPFPGSHADARHDDNEPPILDAKESQRRMVEHMTNAWKQPPPR